MKLNDVFALLDKVAETSDHNRYQMAAAVTMRNRIISFGSNRMKTHPMQKKYARNDHSLFLHAEVNAIKNALRYIAVDDLKKASLVVLRKKDAKRGLSKPCEGCMRAIAEFGIKKVFYTTEEGYAEL